MPALFSSFGYILAALMAFTAFFCWRKATAAFAILTESANRMQVMKTHGQALEKELGKTKERLAINLNIIQKLDKEHNAAKYKIDNELSELREKIGNQTDEQHQLELNADHFKSQCDTLTVQIKDYDFKCKELQNKLSYSDKRVEDQVKITKAANAEDIRGWKDRYRALEGEFKTVRNELNTLKKMTADIKPEELRSLRRKASHFEALFKSMRGLREMAEERNNNWETALRQLSGWVLRTTDKPIDSSKDPIGPVVGAAMELVGQRMVYDEFSEAKSQPANRPASPSSEMV